MAHSPSIAAGDARGRAEAARAAQAFGQARKAAQSGETPTSLTSQVADAYQAGHGHLPDGQIFVMPAAVSPPPPASSTTPFTDIAGRQKVFQDEINQSSLILAAHGTPGEMHTPDGSPAFSNNQPIAVLEYHADQNNFTAYSPSDLC
jgi:hypothetical protein